jgi:hypothetical protein
MSGWSASAQEIRGEAQHWDAQAQAMATLGGLLDQLQLIKPGYDNVGFF